MGLDLPKRGGNIVIDELHFTTSLYMYKELEKKGVELRIVKHRNWAIDVNDMDQRDRQEHAAGVAGAGLERQRLHARCEVGRARWRTRAARYVFADIIQAVGAVPVDVKALGIDFASAGTYKWLMGERGIGFLYVREDLQGTVLPTTRYGHRQVANFNRARADVGAAARRGELRDRRHRRRCSPRACPKASTTCSALGLDKIRAHAPPADRSAAEGTAAARLQAADAARHRDADRSRSS